MNEKSETLRRILALALCCLMLLPLLPSASAQETLSLASEAVVLMDADNGQILYQKNMHKQMYPASITKVLTALLALRHLAPDQTLTVSKSAVDAVPRTSSHISLKVGEQLTVEQALYAIGMESANDAANVLAEAVSGSLAEFGKRMTEEAKALGAYNTQFTNANGLPDSKHYTTAYDMALITRAALKAPGFIEYFSTVEYLLPATNLSDARVFANKDRLLPGGQYYYEGVLMAKTGWTTAAQGTFVTAVKRGDTTLIVVALKSPQLEDKYKDTQKLLNYGFSKYSRITLTGEELAEGLELGDYVPASGQSFSFQLPEGTEQSALTFALAAGTQLPESGYAVAEVTAAMKDALIPNLLLELTRPGQEPEETEAPAGEEETQEELSPEKIRIYVILGVVGVIAAFILYRRFVLWHRRLLRRRALKKKIQRMKNRGKKRTL